jgi:hypothetical protein
MLNKTAKSIVKKELRKVIMNRYTCDCVSEVQAQLDSQCIFPTRDELVDYIVKLLDRIEK